MIEVFTTDVQQAFHAKALVSWLLKHFPGSKINFDLDNCDKILRIEGINFIPENIVMLVKEKGFNCKVLE